MVKVLLLVEDRDDDVFFMQRAIERRQLPCTLRVANSGEQAMAYLEGKGEFGDRATNPLPTLILLDIKMPRVDGIEVLKQIRQHAKLRRLPVVMLSTSKYQPEIDAAYDLGANGYLVKPSDTQELESILEPLIKFWFESNVGPTMKL